MPRGIYKKSLEHREKISALMKGRILSQEIKNKISQTLKNNPTRYWLGKKRPNLFTQQYRKELHDRMLGNQFGKGYSFTNEQRKILSERMLGDKNHNWKGGITPQYILLRRSFDLVLWREAVFKRDNYICQICRQRGGKLHADHILPFALFERVRTYLLNGQTLCVDCHKKTETYGYKLTKILRKINV